MPQRENKMRRMRDMIDMRDNNEISSIADQYLERFTDRYLGEYGPGPAAAPGLPVNLPRPTGAQGATGLTGTPRMQFPLNTGKEKEAVMYAFQKLEDTVPRCDASVPEWIMVAVRNNEKLFSRINISEDTYLTNQQRISGYVAQFGSNCRCKRI